MYLFWQDSTRDTRHNMIHINTLTKTVTQTIHHIFLCRALKNCLNTKTPAKHCNFIACTSCFFAKIIPSNYFFDKLRKDFSILNIVLC